MLRGKTAVVTGASRGIGRAIAECFAKNGANIAIIYAGNEAAAKEVVEKIAESGVEAESYKCDVSSFSETKETVDKILQRFGGVDILVNNAGVVKDSLMLKMSEQDFDSVLSVNLKGAFNMIKHLFPQFARRRKGRIINISSVVGICGNAGQANYAAAKSGIIGLTKSVAKELASRGVTCNAIAPGFIKTDMTDSLPENIKDRVLDQIPMKRMGLAEEIASLALFLASDNAGYITGEVIKADGGLCI